MLDSRKRHVAFTAEFWGSKRRKVSSPTDFQEARSVVALLALTDPSIVTHVMQFVPLPQNPKRGEATRIMGTLVNLCRAIAPFDRALPRYFGPHNQAFWQGMVLRYFDFSTRDTPTETTQESVAPTLAVWTRLGVGFVPSEYGFLHAMQSRGDDLAVWPRKENGFTLFCDLTLLVDKFRGLVKNVPSEKPVSLFVPCLRRPGAIEARVDTRPRTSVLPFESRVRCSRRQCFVQTITTQLEGWTHFRAYENASNHKQGRIDFYAGQSRRSSRWIGLTSVRPSHKPS